jgi:hypothetical protein
MKGRFVMRIGVLAAIAAFALAACDDSTGGVRIPATPAGAQAPINLAGAPPARGQANLTDEERTQLTEGVRSYLQAVEGQIGIPKHETIADVIVPMQPGADHLWNVDLNGGTTYTFVGACDDDCTNIDFELIAPQGGVVASDLLEDDFPVASFTPQANGTYIARLSMRNCGVAPCYAGARTLSGAPGAASTK